ncbi:hypothetical protein [Streptomyces sp. CA-111067]|uniref:hypothetical protein n=1 Tax=Streptomyces sp. CA-111067 TaxID=3240046 RepID=UPI003D98615E
MTTEFPPASEGEPSLPDDVWEQFAQDSERAIRLSAPKEPSARARIVARRLREQEERAAAANARRGPTARRAPGRRAPKARPPASDRPWRTGPTIPAGYGERRGRRTAAVVCVVLVAVLLVVALSPGQIWTWLTTH